jgi:hypothetical protein
LCRRLRDAINKISITFQIPESDSKEGLKAFSQRLQQELIDEIFRIYQGTKGLSEAGDLSV